MLFRISILLVQGGDLGHQAWSGSVSVIPAEGDEPGGLQHVVKKAVSVNRINKTTQHPACVAQGWSGNSCWLEKERWLKGAGKGGGQGGSLKLGQGSVQDANRDLGSSPGEVVGQCRDGSHKPRGRTARGCGGKSDFRGNCSGHIWV